MFKTVAFLFILLGDYQYHVTSECTPNCYKDNYKCEDLRGVNCAEDAVFVPRDFSRCECCDRCEKIVSFVRISCILCKI